LKVPEAKNLGKIKACGTILYSRKVLLEGELSVLDNYGALFLLEINILLILN